MTDKELAEAYKKQRDSLLEFMQNAPVSSGVCCCGNDISKYYSCDNHSPVDQWDHNVDRYTEELAKFDATIK